MPRLSHAARKRYESGYGAFPGGDPRRFSPDPECSTPEERAAHARACVEWTGRDLAAPVAVMTAAECAQAFDEGRAVSATVIGDVAHVHLVGFGLGSYEFRVPIRSRRQRLREHREFVRWMGERFGDAPTFAECERAESADLRAILAERGEP